MNLSTDTAQTLFGADRIAGKTASALPITFSVSGVPKPGGSKKGFYIQKIKRVVITEACKGAANWRELVAHAAIQAYKGPLLDEPLSVTMTFFVRRPQCHYGAKGLKSSSPLCPTTKPDVLKLARSTEDALTGVLWVDDSRTVTLKLHKRFGDRPGVEIIVERA